MPDARVVLLLLQQYEQDKHKLLVVKNYQDYSYYCFTSTQKAFKAFLRIHCQMLYSNCGYEWQTDVDGWGEDNRKERETGVW